MPRWFSVVLVQAILGMWISDLAHRGGPGPGYAAAQIAGLWGWEDVSTSAGGRLCAPCEFSTLAVKYTVYLMDFAIHPCSYASSLDFELATSRLVDTSIEEAILAYQS